VAVESRLYPKGKVISQPVTVVEKPPPEPPVPPLPVEEAPRVIVFDRNQAAIDAAEKAKAPKPVLSAQTKREMEAGRLTLRRLQGLED
jgi:hypothetical protein